MKKVIGVLVVVLIVVMGYVFTKDDALDKNNDELKAVTVSQAFDVFVYAALYIADEKGFFQEEGLDVNIVTAGGDEKAFASLVSGDAQFAIGDPTFVAIAGEKGQPGKVVGAVLNGVPFWGVTNKASISTINTPSELGTYSVATFPAPSTAYALQKKMFEAGSLAPNIKETAFGALIAALQGGDVDIALELEPNVSTAVESGSRVVYSLADYYPNFAFTGVTVLPDMIENEPETIQSFINALQRADRYIRTNPEESAQVMVNRFPDVSEDVAKNALKNVSDAKVIPETTLSSKEGWDIAIQLRKDVGDIKKDAPFEMYVDNSFAQKAQ